ncbi:MAG: radical SAM protein [Pseudomonadota bacterium]
MNKRELTELLQGADDRELFERAALARMQLCGEAVHVRGIIEFSNACSLNCLYCGLRRDNRSLKRYCMEPGEILSSVAQAGKIGVKTIVLQSGESDAYPPEKLAGVIARIKKSFNVAVTLCTGVRAEKVYAMWREAGADRYLMKFEAATPSLHGTVKEGSSLSSRLAAIEDLRRSGYQVGSGSIIGLPGQTPADLAADLMLACELDLDMAAFGPLVPHPNTPVSFARPGDMVMSLRVIAAARILLGPVHIAATTAFDALAPDGRARALAWGANAIMANLTPERYRDLYDIYPGRGNNSPDAVAKILRRIGRPPARCKGHSLKGRVS